jgi:hypothetical protein
MCLVSNYQHNICLVWLSICIINEQYIPQDTDKLAGMQDLMTEDMEIQQVGLNAFRTEVHGVYQPLIAPGHQQRLCQDILQVAEQWQSQLASAHLQLQAADSSYNVVLGGMSGPQDFLPSQMYLAHATMSLAEAAVSQLLSHPDLASLVQLAQELPEQSLLSTAEHMLVTTQASKKAAEKELEDAQTSLRQVQRRYNDAVTINNHSMQSRLLEDEKRSCSKKVRHPWQVGVYACLLHGIAPLHCKSYVAY